ncbi:MAG: hypothetical protein GX190_01200 [Mollicutes bacterium]|nr:hypothetical protein [Mollicutes bacterium]
MNYIYDVILNFHDRVYEFYDWNINDKIIHIRKIPLMKISSQDLIKIKNNKIKISQELKEQLKNKTEVFTKNLKGIYTYACLFCDGTTNIGVVFDDEGVSILKSSMLIDEENEVIDVCERITDKTIKYKIIEKEEQDPFKTRRELEMDEYIKKEIIQIDDLEKLRYLYYECFNETETDKSKILNRIYEALENNWSNIAPILYDFFKLTSIQK